MSNIAPREQQIKQGLIAQQRVIKSLFGDKAKADKFLATASKVATDYKLAQCNPNSIIDACVTVAQLNLDLSPALAHAYIVPFKNSVTLIVSARGYTALMARNGWKIKSYIVNEEDDFEYIINGFEESIKFQKNIDSETNTFRLAVALAQSPDGTLYIEVMNAKQIDKHRLVSSNQKGAPTGVWKDWFEEMAKKTVIKKLVKTLPLGEDVANAIAKDDKPIDAELIEEKQVPQAQDLNQTIKQAPQERDMLEDIEIEPYNPQTGEVISQKPNMSILDNVNSDGTDREV